MLLLLVLLLLLTRASSLLPGFSLLPLEGSGSFGVWWWNTAAPTCAFTPARCGDWSGLGGAGGSRRLKPKRGNLC